MNDHPPRSIDKWMRYVAILGPMVSGIVFGTVGYISGFQSARKEIAINAKRMDLMEGWKERQEEFNLKTVAAISRLKALMRDSTP